MPTVWTVMPGMKRGEIEAAAIPERVAAEKPVEVVGDEHPVERPHRVGHHDWLASGRRDFGDPAIRTLPSSPPAAPFRARRVFYRSR